MNKYNVFHKSGASCVFSKTYNDGYQSLFSLTVAPITDGENKKTTILFIDDEKKNKTGWRRTKNLNLDVVLNEFSRWGPDAPPEYTRIIGDYLGRELRTSEIEKEASIDIGIGSKGPKVETGLRKRKKL